VTDWDALYLRLRSSSLGQDFPRERFLRTPLCAISTALEFISNEEQRTHNLASVTTAKLCLQLISQAGDAGGELLGLDAEVPQA
jgi:hypothetical protein